jgi:hypothetical protein
MVVDYIVVGLVYTLDQSAQGKEQGYIIYTFMSWTDKLGKDK